MAGIEKVVTASYRKELVSEILKQGYPGKAYPREVLGDIVLRHDSGVTSVDLDNVVAASAITKVRACIHCLLLKYCRNNRQSA